MKFLDTHLKEENFNNIEKLLELRRKLVLAYDRVKEATPNQKTSRMELIKSFNTIKEAVLSVDYMIDEIISMPAVTGMCRYICTSKDIVIKPQEKKELDLNIVKLDYWRLRDYKIKYLFDGIIPTNGYLKFWNEREKVFVENKVQKEEDERYSLRKVDYSSPYESDYLEPGVYKIKKNNPIGIIRVYKNNSE